MKPVWAGTLALLMAAASAADDKPKPVDPPPKADDAKTPAQQLKAWKKEADEAQNAAYDLFRKAQKETDKEKAKALQEEGSKRFAESQKKRVEYAGKAAALAKADPKSATGFDAAVWAVQGLRGKPAEVKEVFGLIREHHLTSDRLLEVLGWVAYLGLPEEEVVDFLTAVAEKNPAKSIQATALLGLGEVYKNKTEPYGRPAPKNAAELLAKAEAYFERVVKEFGTVPGPGFQTFGQRADRVLFEIRNLAIGKVAPDIEGEDLDGVRFKLSDYRGKVVVLDFWGDW